MPKTCLTPSSLRASQSASAARMRLRVASAHLRVANLTRVWQVHVLAADPADLHVELVDRAAAGALSLGLELLHPVEKRREQAEERKAEPDQKPDEERAALDAADDRRREAEEEEDDESGHGLRRSSAAISWWCWSSDCG